MGRTCDALVEVCAFQGLFFPGSWALCGLTQILSGFSVPMMFVCVCLSLRHLASSSRTPPLRWKAYSCGPWCRTPLLPAARSWPLETGSWPLMGSACSSWTTRGTDDLIPAIPCWIQSNQTVFTDYSHISSSLLVGRSWSSPRVTGWGYWWPDRTGWLKWYRLNADSVFHWCVQGHVEHSGFGHNALLNEILVERNTRFQLLTVVLQLSFAWVCYINTTKCH